MGIPVTERARMLGHSVDTNMKHYTFARSDEYLGEISDMWNDYIDETRAPKSEKNKGPLRLSNLRQKKKAVNPLKLRL